MARPARAYWICQAAGWSLYVAVTIYELSVSSVAGSRKVVEPLAAAAFGVGLTHAFRHVAQRRQWPALGAGALIPRVVLGSVVLSVAHVGLLAIVEMGFYGDRPESPGLALLFATMRWIMVFFIWLALYFGYALIEQRREGELRRLVAEKALQAAELSSLRSQLNPHFLFNSLNSIRALVASDPAVAQTAITRIAKILRYTLGSGREQTVSFERELEVVEDYLALEALRLEDRLLVEREIASDVRGVEIPIMLLQLLVENAIKHGISHLPRGGTLRIQAGIEDGGLLLLVENPRPLERVSSDEDSSGIGFSNASERLRLLYGPSASVNLDLSVPERAIARVLIPTTRLTSRISDGGR